MRHFRRNPGWRWWFVAAAVLVGPLSLQGDDPANRQPSGAAAPSPAAPATAPGSGNGRLQKLRQFREQLGTAQEDLAKLKRVTWQVGDDARPGLVYVPPVAGTAENPPPLVIAFHGHGGRSEHAARKFAFHRHWPEAVCIYPQGLPTAVPTIDPEGKLPGWQKYIGDQQDRDLKLFDAIVRAAESEYRIDPRRVYVAGHSNGGYFAYVLWAARGDQIAAIAPVAATLDLRDVRRLQPKPVLHVAGEADKIVRFDLQQRTMDYVRKLNGCDGDGKRDGEFCTEYRSGDGPTVVTWIHPGGHEIPAASPPRIVKFFQGVAAPQQP